MLGRNSHDTYMWCTKPSPWQCRTLRLFLFSIMLLMWTHVPSAPENCLSSSRDRGGIMDALLRKSQQDPRWKSCESCEEKHDSWFMTFLWNQDFPVGHFRSDGQSLIMANVSKWACQTRSLNLKIFKKTHYYFRLLIADRSLKVQWYNVVPQQCVNQSIPQILVVSLVNQLRYTLYNGNWSGWG